MSQQKGGILIMKLDRLDSYINDLAINAQQSKGCKKVAKKGCK